MLTEEGVLFIFEGVDFICNFVEESRSIHLVFSGLFGWNVQLDGYSFHELLGLPEGELHELVPIGVTGSKIKKSNTMEENSDDGDIISTHIASSILH